MRLLKMNSCLNWCTLTGTALTALAAGTAGAANNYTILDLGTLGWLNSSAGGFASVNASGQVTGTSEPEDGLLRPFRTAPNSAITPANNVGAFTGNSVGHSINDVGQVVGYSEGLSNGYLRAYRTAPNAAIAPADDLGTLGGPTAVAYAVNNSGQAVGYSYLDEITSRHHAFRTAPNGSITAATDLGTLGGFTSVAWGVNNLGQAVGVSRLPGDVIGHAFRTAPNGVITPATDLGTLGGSQSGALGINESGQVVGYANTATEEIHAFRTTPGGLITPAGDLGSLGGTISYAAAINESGQAVGYSHLAGNSTTHAFFADVGQAMVDLNTLVPPSQWIITEATGINDSGQISATATLDGVTHALLLTPVPEPAALALLGTVSVAALGRRGRVRIRVGMPAP